MSADAAPPAEALASKLASLDAGGSAEGGAARTGHSGSARDHYTECPLPDLLRLAGNDALTAVTDAMLKGLAMMRPDVKVVK